MAAVELSHRANRQLGLGIRSEEFSPDTLAARAIQLANETISDPPEEGSNPGDSYETTSEDKVALMRFSASSDDFGEMLSERDVQAIDEQIECDLSSESLESAQDIWHDTGALQRKVLRLASHTLCSSPKTYTEGTTTSTPPSRSGIEFEMPVIFVCPPKNTDGPVVGSEILYLNGTDASLIATDTNLQNEIAMHEQFSIKGIGTTENEHSTWATMLNELQRMERDSMAWEEEEYTRTGDDKRPRVVWDDHTMAVALQKERRDWGTMPSNVKRPYAVTSICHLVEMVAMLGLHWKEFDQSQDRYRAEGNGYVLTGATLANLGIVFNFRISGKRKFRENRLIPANEVKGLCFGVVPTIYQGFNDASSSEEPLDEGLFSDLSVLQLGSPQEIAQTLILLGCNRDTTNYICSERFDHTHLFPGRLNT